jgi:DNA ligase (NAD+)
MCKNDNCSGKLLGKLNFFVSKPAMNIDGLSEAILQLLIDKGWVKSFKNIYHLSTHQNEWKRCEGFGPKSVNKLLAAIEASRHVKLENFITSLSIPGVGKSVSKLISETFHSDFDAFIKAFEDGYDWSDLEGVGDVLAANINDYLSKNQAEVRDLASEFTFIQTQVRADNTLNGLRFCITGSFTQSRDALKAKLESKGAKFVGGVSKNLDVLFCGDNAGSKLTKAQALGVKVADEKQLLAILGE